MRTPRHKRSLTLLFAAYVALFLPTWAQADSAGHLMDRGIDVYYAVFPAEMIRGHEKQHPEATMHGGMPRSGKAYHLMVALFEATTKRRITDAQVVAKVGEIGLSAEEKKLEPFVVAGALTYGNYFKITLNANYRVEVNVHTPSSMTQAHVEFALKLEQ